MTIYPVDAPAEEFDAVVLATHADQSLKMLSDANETERAILSAFPYQPNTAVLHSDASQMPIRKRAWASWNYRSPQTATAAARPEAPASVTYWLNRLQNLASDEPVFVTLNAASPISPASIHRTMTYHHPAFSLRSIAAQRRWKEINGRRRTWYCGAYWGYGFHEDGVNSALRVAAEFGISLKDLSSTTHREPSPAMLISSN